MNMGLKRQFIGTTLATSLDEDWTLSNPLSDKNEDIYTPEDINNKFDDISYGKGTKLIAITQLLFTVLLLLSISTMKPRKFCNQNSKYRVAHRKRIRGI